MWIFEDQLIIEKKKIRKNLWKIIEQFVLMEHRTWQSSVPPEAPLYPTLTSQGDVSGTDDWWWLPRPEQPTPLTQADNEQSYLPAQHRPGWHHSHGWLQVVVGGTGVKGIF